MTPQYTLRPFKPSDAVSIAMFANNRNVSMYIPNIPHPYQLKDAEWFLRKVRREDKKETHIHRAIVIDEIVAGAIGISGLKEKQGEFGYWLAEDYWGRGIMSQVAHEFLTMCFEKGYRKIRARVFAPNSGSSKVLLKNGFTHEGTLRKEKLIGAEYVDELYYGLLKEDFENLR